MRLVAAKLAGAWRGIKTWFRSRKSLSRRYVRVQIELRKWRRIATNMRASAKEWRAEAERLGSAVSDQERELTSARREIERLESERLQAAREIQGLVLINTRLQSFCKAEIARTESVSVHASNGATQRDLLEELR